MNDIQTPAYRTNVRGEPITINDRFLRAQQAADKCAIHRSTVYALMESYHFPQSIQVSRGRVAWLEADIEEFMRLGAEGFYQQYGMQIEAEQEKVA